MNQINHIISYFHRLIKIITEEQFNFSELQGSLIAIVWGFWLFFVGFPISTILTQAFSLPIVGLLGMALGVIQIWSLLSNHIGWRRKTAMVAVIYWLFLAIDVSATVWTLIIVPFLYLFALTAAWAFWRTGRLVSRN